MTRKATDQVTTIGIDIGKNNFHLIGLDGAENIVLRRKLSRSQVIVRLANLPSCLIGMEACVGAHHLSRQLQALGHDARLLPAQYVKPYLRGQKNDFRDAEAIAEAARSAGRRPASADALRGDEVGRAARSPGFASGRLAPGAPSHGGDQPDPRAALGAWHCRTTGR